MVVGIAGLGLIGGSFAKAYAEKGHIVYGFDIDRSTVDFAKLSGAINDELTEDNIGECELVLVALYPQAAIDYIEKMADRFAKTAVVIDCCGTKRTVCGACFEIAAKHGFTYVGGHPMAGTHNSGFKYARSNMFHGAPMVVVPAEGSDIMLLQRVKDLLEPCEFGKMSITTAEKHDQLIAFTSQMAHVVSNGYIKSPTALEHKGFSAGSYKDMTRVAWLNPRMWAELFIENREYLLNEMDVFIKAMQEYRDALDDSDVDRLIQLLDDGRRRKAEVDGR